MGAAVSTSDATLGAEAELVGGRQVFPGCGGGSGNGRGGSTADADAVVTHDDNATTWGCGQHGSADGAAAGAEAGAAAGAAVHAPAGAAAEEAAGAAAGPMASESSEIGCNAACAKDSNAALRAASRMTSLNISSSRSSSVSFRGTAAIVTESGGRFRSARSITLSAASHAAGGGSLGAPGWRIARGWAKSLSR